MSDEHLKPLEFVGVEIPCIVLSGWQVPPQPMAFMRTGFAGVDGVSSIRMGNRERTLDIHILLRGGFDTRYALENFIDVDLYQLVGENGTLTYFDIDNEFEQPFYDCDFEGFFRTDSPRPDVAGTLAGTGEGEGWHVLGILRFTQLGGGSGEE